MLATKETESTAESPSTMSPRPTGHSPSTSWAHGLRGFAAVMVVASHTVLCFCRYMVLPRSSENGPYYFFQLPIARLPAQGQAWVAVFFVLLGFVNPLKTISQCRSGEYSSALTYLAANSFKRLGRLIFPAATMTVLAWFACQLGFLNLSLHSEAYWLRITSANPSENWVQAIDDLLKALVSTWFYADNPYDQPQWALPYLFKGSIFVFITLLTTCRATPRFRMLAYTVLYIWSWSIGECLVGTNVFFGMFLAEFSFTPYASVTATSHPLLRFAPYLLSLFALVLMSYPNEYTHWAPWSNLLLNLGQGIFPDNTDYGRAWPGIGAQVLSFSIAMSPGLRQLMNLPTLQWLGGLSHPLYLLHGPLMRSVLSWMVFGPVVVKEGLPTPIQNQDGSWFLPVVPFPKTVVFVIVLPIFFAFLLYVVNVWNKKVEPLFGDATQAFEKMAFGDEEEKKSMLPTHQRQSSRGGEKLQEKY